MDLALETEPHAQKADFKVDKGYRHSFAVYRKQRFLWLIPVWKSLSDYHSSVALAEAWLRDNWKHPSYFKFNVRLPK